MRAPEDDFTPIEELFLALVRWRWPVRMGDYQPPERVRNRKKAIAQLTLKDILRLEQWGKWCNVNPSSTTPTSPPPPPRLPRPRKT